MKIFQDTVTIKREAEYRITVATDVLDASDGLLKSLVGNKRIFVALDAALQHDTGPALKRYFAEHQIAWNMAVIPGGEPCKSVAVAEALSRDILRSGISRGDLILAVGGGALLDLVGYVANRVHRGIPHINMPTTFLAQVDAGVGIKNAINFDGYKNTLGSFYPPRETIVDLAFLESLPDRDLRSGLAESIKVAIVLNRNLFQKLEDGIIDVFRRSIREESVTGIVQDTIMTHVRQIALDPFEQRPERPLVFGHEWAHWLEIQTDHALSHGEAVSLGVLIDCHIAHARHLLSQTELGRIRTLLRKAGLPDYHFWLESDLVNDCDILFRGLKKHQEHQYGDQTLIALPHGIGRSEYVSDIRRDEVVSAVRSMLADSRSI